MRNPQFCVSGKKPIVDKHINIWTRRKNVLHVADDICECCIFLKNVFAFSLIFHKSINNVPANIQILACHRTGNKPLSEPMSMNRTSTNANLKTRLATNGRYIICSYNSSKQSSAARKNRNPTGLTHQILTRNNGAVVILTTHASATAGHYQTVIPKSRYNV